jgi:predicted metalloprotease with PDZ domain
MFTKSLVVAGLMRRPLALIVLSTGLVMPSAARAQCRFPAASTEHALTYRFQPDVSPDRLVLHVTVEFQAGATGTDELAVPAHWADEILHALTNLRTATTGASIEDGPNPDTKILHATANEPVQVSYDLKKDWTGPLINPFQFHPVLMPEYFEFTGTNALVRPKRDDSATTTANFDWQLLPLSWVVATSFGTGSSPNDRCQTYAGPSMDIVHGLYAAGDFRIRRFEIGRRAAVLAVRGTWTFTDDEAIALLQKAIGAVRDFWRDDNFPYFLVTLKPYDRDTGSSDGSAFTNAFWMYVSRQDSLTNLLPQLAHEAFHAWNVARMGSLSNDANRATKWFQEGPTNYYGSLLVYRAGAMPLKTYVDSLNQDLRKFPTSTDPYVRGRVIALWLDAAIRHESHGQHSLDDVMFDLVRTNDQPFTLARILGTAGHYLSADTSSELQRAVVEQGNLAAPEDVPAVGTCARPILEDLPTFDLGFDLAASVATKQVVGVVANGPAFAAGLRNGQTLGGASSSNGHPERLATVTIQTDAGDQPIAFYPRGKAIQRWQYHLDQSGSCGANSVK